MLTEYRKYRTEKSINITSKKKKKKADGIQYEMMYSSQIVYICNFFCW